MPTPTLNPHLPFGENKNADWYGKDILSVVIPALTNAGAFLSTPVV